MMFFACSVNIVMIFFACSVRLHTLQQAQQTPVQV